MYDGKQVLRVETKYKKKDLFNIGKEMTDRKGTGNYDKDRTKFNIEYVSMSKHNLYQEVLQKLNENKIEYLNKANTNLLNGITFTSGTEFFERLGMKFINSKRTYKTGNKKGQLVKVPYIRSEKDIPKAVSYYFDSCMEFLKDYVGEENIILAQIHYDEDTPHLQAYFLPIVNEVKRKCYVKDKIGNLVKEKVKNKKGEATIIPKLLRDDKGKIVYETVKGKFLNNDQFWKNKGGKNSYAKMQDLFNKYITEKGFKLDRGNIGSNVEHKTKLEWQIEENKAELEILTKEKENILKIIENSKKNIEITNKAVNKDVLNPKKNIMGYNSNDVERLTEYSKGLEKINIMQKNELDAKAITIEKLSEENKNFRNNEEIIKRNQKIIEQHETIKEQNKELKRLNDLVNILENNINNLKIKFEEEITKWKNLFYKMCNAVDKLLNRKPKANIRDYEILANSINRGRYGEKNKKGKDNFDLSL